MALLDEKTTARIAALEADVKELAERLDALSERLVELENK